MEEPMFPNNTLHILAFVAPFLMAMAASAELALGPFLRNHVSPLSTADLPNRTSRPRSALGSRTPRSTSFIAASTFPPRPERRFAPWRMEKVRIAGSHPGYVNPLIPIRHYKPNSGGSCANRGCYQHFSSSGCGQSTSRGMQ
jgi:hypothetical protein